MNSLLPVKCLVWICVLVWIENILNAELFKNDDVTIITSFPCPSFLQTQIQNDWAMIVTLSNSFDIV